MNLRTLRSSRFWNDTRGLTTIEYVIVLALIAALSVGIWQKLGKDVKKYLTDSKSDISNAMKNRK